MILFLFFGSINLQILVYHFAMQNPKFNELFLTFQTQYSALFGGSTIFNLTVNSFPGSPGPGTIHNILCLLTEETKPFSLGKYKKITHFNINVRVIGYR